MSSPRFAFAKYERLFQKPFQFGNHRLIAREGILLRMEISRRFFYSEASPLFSHSNETIETVIEHLRKGKSSPSIANAIAGLKAQEVLSGGAKFYPVKSNALLAWEGQSATALHIDTLAQKGYRTFKIKILPSNWREVLQFLESASFQFRLDANQSFDEKTLKECFAFIRASQKLKDVIEYFEEPLPLWNHSLLLDSPIPIAIDESLGTLEDLSAFISREKAPNVFILKPSALGSVKDILAKIQGYPGKAVFTSSLEIEAGRRSLIAQLSVCGVEETCGLSTGFLFEENYLEDLPLYSELPKVSDLENSFYKSLQWQELPC